MNFRSLGVLAILLMLLFGPWPILAQGSPGSEEIDPIQGPPAYVIQPNDLLEIVVWGEPEISRSVLVRPDGRISVDLIGDVMATGGTTEEIAADIRDKISRFKRDAVVTVSVTVSR